MLSTEEIDQGVGLEDWRRSLDKRCRHSNWLCPGEAVREPAPIAGA